MTDSNVTELRPSPATGEVVRPKVKDPTAALRQRRRRANKRRDSAADQAVTQASATSPVVASPDVTVPTVPLSAKIQRFEKSNDFKGDVTVSPAGTVTAGKSNKSNGVTPFVESRWQVADIAAYGAAIGLATVAAWFSIKGMVVLFPGAPLAVVGMAVAMEISKLVTAGWLARRWRATAWCWRFALMAFVLGLAVINGAGVFSQLVAAHVGERGAAMAGFEIRDAEIASRIEVATHAVADLDARVGQIDATIAEATRRGRTTGAVSIMEAQRRARAGLVDERNRETGTLASLKAERATVAAKGRQVETDAAPIRYVAELVGANTDSERAIRWLIALMVLCCDPLAIALTAAASARRSEARRDEQSESKLVHSAR